MFQPFLLKPGTSSTEVLKVIDLLTKSQKWKQAETVARQGLKAFPNNHAIFIEFTKILANNGRHIDAINALKAGINNTPLEPTLYFELQDHYFRLRDLVGMQANEHDFLRAYSRGMQNVHRRNAFVFLSSCAVHSLYLSDYTAQDRWRAQLNASQYVEASSKRVRHRLARKSSRPHVGFLSTQITGHAVSRFVGEFLLNVQSEKRYTLFYDIAQGSDEGLSKTQKYLKNAKSRINIVPISSDKATESCSVIAKEQVDILVELSGHFSGAPLNIIAMKPAPIQASWIGYPSHPGLSAIDYFLTDYFCQPDVNYLGDHSKNIYRFNRFFSAYEDKSIAHVSNEWQPSECIRFGSFNNINKLSDATLATWAKILDSLPTATLTLKFSKFYPYELKRIKDFFARPNLSRRITILDTSPSHTEHLKQYCNIDIALDTFPYNGTTTTCEALNMGVPVITLLGEDHVSRVGGGILNAIGYDELIASNEEQYVEKAVALANDRNRLKNNHENLRNIFQSSSLSDFLSMVEAFEKFVDHALEEHREAQRT